MLTITVSIASGGDAIFSMVPRAWFGPEALRLSPDEIGTWWDPVQRTKLGIEFVAIGVLTILNIRGVKESVQAIAPVFMTFVVTHVVLLVVAIFGNAGEVGTVAHADERQLRAHDHVARHLRRPDALRARLLARRRDVHRHRGGLERRPDHARAEGPHGQEHDGA